MPFLTFASSSHKGNSCILLPSLPVPAHPSVFLLLTGHLSPPPSSDAQGRLEPWDRNIVSVTELDNPLLLVCSLEEMSLQTVRLLLYLSGLGCEIVVGMSAHSEHRLTGWLEGLNHRYPLGFIHICSECWASVGLSGWFAGHPTFYTLQLSSPGPGNSSLALRTFSADALDRACKIPCISVTT